jgi:class 3 adenylate cyclase
MAVPFIEYVPPPPSGRPPAYLIEMTDGGEGRRFAFHDRLEIGRYEPGRSAGPGVLRVQDPTVSSRHCVLTLGRDGRYTLRDLSRNGVRIDGRRTVPGVEMPVDLGQTIAFGENRRFRLEGSALLPSHETVVPLPGTAVTDDVTACTVVVGDIRGFTRLVQGAASEVLHHAVTRVFETLQEEVARAGGTVKEYQGDAIVAFWELGPGGQGAAEACRGVLSLHRLARDLARDPAVWNVPGFPLAFDWALASGPVSFENVGGAHRTGLSMVGESVVLAFRLEKLADETTGPILACPVTRELAGDAFPFRDLGERSTEGFDRPVRVFSLEEPEP